MKKIFWLLIIAGLLTGALWFKVSAGGTAPIGVTFQAPALKAELAGAKLESRINETNINCSVLDAEKQTVSCQVPENFSGETVTIWMNLGDHFWVFQEVAIP